MGGPSEKWRVVVRSGEVVVDGKEGRTNPGQKACQWSNCYLPAEGQWSKRRGSNSFQL